METRDLNYWTKRMKEYVNKTSNHLFIDEKQRFVKVIPFTKDGKELVAVIRFKEDSFRMYIRDLEATHPNDLFHLKTGIFPQNGCCKSIPNFKKARQFAEQAKAILELKGKDGEKDILKLTEIIYKTDEVIV